MFYFFPLYFQYFFFFTSMIWLCIFVFHLKLSILFFFHFLHIYIGRTLSWEWKLIFYVAVNNWYQTQKILMFERKEVPNHIKFIFIIITSVNRKRERERECVYIKQKNKRTSVLQSLRQNQRLTPFYFIFLVILFDLVLAILFIFLY